MSKLSLEVERICGVDKPKENPYELKWKLETKHSCIPLSQRSQEALINYEPLERNNPFQ